MEIFLALVWFFVIILIICWGVVNVFNAASNKAITVKHIIIAVICSPGTVIGLIFLAFILCTYHTCKGLVALIEWSDECETIHSIRYWIHEALNKTIWRF